MSFDLLEQQPGDNRSHLFLLPRKRKTQLFSAPHSHLKVNTSLGNQTSLSCASGVAAWENNCPVNYILNMNTAASFRPMRDKRKGLFFNSTANKTVVRYSLQ